MPRTVKLRLNQKPKRTVTLNLDELTAATSPADYGQRLGAMVFANLPLRDDYIALRSQAHQPLHLELVDDADHAVAWERLQFPLDTAQSEWEPVAWAAQRPFARYLPSESNQPPRTLSQPPVRVLLLLASPSDVSQFGLPDVSEEAFAVLRQPVANLPQVNLTLLQSRTAHLPTLDNLKDALSDGPGYDLLYVVAHGKFSAKQEQTMLYLSDADDKTELCPADDFIAAVQNASQHPAMVFLAACESARPSDSNDSPDSASDLLGLGPQLVRRVGITTVVAMRERVSIAIATAFSDKFFRQLFYHGQPPQAMNEARHALPTDWDASIPVLFSRLPELKNQALLAETLLTGPSLAEQAYLRRVQARFDRQASRYINLHAAADEVINPLLTDPDLDMSPEFVEWQVEQGQGGEQIKRVELDNLRQGVDQYQTIILLGDPGGGKTTALQNLAHQFAGEALAERSKLPFFFPLSDFQPGQTVLAFMQSTLRRVAAAKGWESQALADHLERHLEAGRCFILFDALNEMPRQDYALRARALRDFIDRWRGPGNRFIVSCRVLDYGNELSGLQRVEVRGLSPSQIEALLRRALPPAQAEVMWAKLKESDEQDADRSLLTMARNPYRLKIMLDSFQFDGNLPRNPAQLMRRLTEILWRREEKVTPPDKWLPAEQQAESLSRLAFAMQTQVGSGAVAGVDDLALTWPAPAEQVLDLAQKADLLEFDDVNRRVRFYHQLLQEYFAAVELLNRVAKIEISPTPTTLLDRLRRTLPTKQRAKPPGLGQDPLLDALWAWPWLENEQTAFKGELFGPRLPPPSPTGWEETTILAAGLLPDSHTADAFIHKLLLINPILAGRCVAEGRAVISSALRDDLTATLIKTMHDERLALRVRVTAGEVLGAVGDPRLAAPYANLITIPAGEFLMGEGKAQHSLFLPEYRIGKYPVTNQEFAQFIEADGYHTRRWWTEAGWVVKQEKDWKAPRFWDSPFFSHSNQPVSGVSWYEADAFCQWLTQYWRIEGHISQDEMVRLPTESEWEKGARGDQNGRTYTWGHTFDKDKLNHHWQVGRPTPVGLYLSGVSLFGLFDCLGSIWEWCLTGNNTYPYENKLDSLTRISSVHRCVLKGGAWNAIPEINRISFRNFQDVDRVNKNYGLRVVVAPILNPQ